MKIYHISKNVFYPIMIALILIVCSTLSIISYYNSSEVLKESIIQSMKWRTEDNAVLISHHIAGLKTLIEGIALRTEVQSMDWNLQRPVLNAETKRLAIKNFQVVDLNGFAHSTSGKTPDLSDTEWVKKALQGITSVSEPILGDIDNQMIIACVAPIKNKEGDIVGALWATIDPQFLFNIIKNVKVVKTGYGFIIGKKETIIAHPNKNIVLSERSLNKDIISEQKGFILYRDDGVEKCATYFPIPNTDWNLFLSAPTEEVFSGIDILKNKFMLLTLTTIVIWLIFCLLGIGYIMEKRKIAGLEKCVEEDKRLLSESAEIENIRTQFFANISHEFRTPLNVILSSLQLFKLYFEKEEALQSTNLNKHLKTMKQNCYRLLRLVNNLIDTTRIDVGFLETHMQNHNIVKIVEDITMSIVEFTEMKGIIMLFDTDVEEKIIACDVDKIERIILNLISNAIKFTDPGGEIFVNVFDKQESVVITIKDTGIGIPKDKQELIFERFVQVEQSLNRNQEGSGIGLSMCKSFVEMHGGTLNLDSEQGYGSEFIIEFPVNILKTEEYTECIREVESQQRIERIKIEFSDIYCL